MKTLALCVFTLGAFVGSGNVSTATTADTLLSSFPIFASVNGVVGFWSSVDLGLYYPNPSPALITEHVLPSTVSQLFSWTASTPGFADLAARMTDGLDENINCYESGNYGGNAESAWLTGIFGFSRSINGIDLQGFNISHIDMRVDSFTLISPGRDPLGDGIWTDINISGQFLIYGSPVPEPANVTALALGSLALVMVRRRNSF